MAKTVTFSKNVFTNEHIASFYIDDRMTESKTLTNVELEGLSEIIDFATLPITLNAEDLEKETDNLYFDTEDEGQQTNFEIILQQLIAQT